MPVRAAPQPKRWTTRHSFASELGLGLKATIESIDNRGDFRVYMQNYAYAHGGATRGPRREGPPESGFVRFPLVFVASCPYSSTHVPRRSLGFPPTPNGCSCPRRPRSRPRPRRAARRTQRARRRQSAAGRRSASTSRSRWRGTTSRCRSFSRSAARRWSGTASRSKASTA